MTCSDDHIGNETQKESVVRTGDYRDCAIEALADNEAALLDRVHQLEADVAAERLIRQQLLGLLQLAFSEPEGWPRGVALMHDAHMQMAREVIADMFVTEHGARRNAA